MMNSHNVFTNGINHNNNKNFIEDIDGRASTPQSQPYKYGGKSNIEYSVSPSNPKSRKRCCILTEGGARKRLYRHRELSHSEIVITEEENPADSMEIDPCCYNNGEEDQDPSDMIIVQSPSNMIADDDDHVMLDAEEAQVSESTLQVLNGTGFSANQNMPEGGSWHFLPCPNGNGGHSIFFV